MCDYQLSFDWNFTKLFEIHQCCHLNSLTSRRWFSNMALNFQIHGLERLEKSLNFIPLPDLYKPRYTDPKYSCKMKCLDCKIRLARCDFVASVEMLAVHVNNVWSKSSWFEHIILCLHFMSIMPRTSHLTIKLIQQGLNLQFIKFATTPWLLQLLQLSVNYTDITS
jgi:hypothetical protein